MPKSEDADARLREFAPGELQAIAAFFDECARRYPDGIYDVKLRKAASAVRARLQTA
jgi:hypothetical protein